MGGARTLGLIRQHGWRLFVCATGHDKNSGLPYAIDNGAWHAYSNQKPWDRVKFERLIASHGAGADFIVVPDVVGDAHASLARSVEWLPELAGVAPLYLAVQDGMTDLDLIPHLPQIAGLFVGGTTDWKLKTMGTWAALAHRFQKRVHIGRVNTRRRIRLCHLIGADSFDGTSVSMYSKTIHPLDAEVRQPALRLFR